MNPPVAQPTTETSQSEVDAAKQRLDFLMQQPMPPVARELVERIDELSEALCDLQKARHELLLNAGLD